VNFCRVGQDLICLVELMKNREYTSVGIPEPPECLANVLPVSHGCSVRFTCVLGTPGVLGSKGDRLHLTSGRRSRIIGELPPSPCRSRRIRIAQGILLPYLNYFYYYFKQKVV